MQALLCLATLAVAACGPARDGAPVDTARDTESAAAPAPAPDASDAGAYVARGACPFECCVYGRWRVFTPAVLRARPATGADSIGWFDANTDIVADSGLVRVNPTGLAVVTGKTPGDFVPDTVAVAVGDTLELLDYEGEGYRNARWKGRLITVMEYWSMLGAQGVSLVRRPVSQWWVHATSGDRRGWMLMDSVRVRGADRCAGPV